MSKRRVRVAVTSRIGVLFLLSGILSLVISIYYTFQILALIGLGLTFWGVLFLLLKAPRLVDGSLLYSSAIPSYLTIERILDALGYKGKGYYIPPYPKDIYLPEYLKGLKASVIFISAKSNTEMPSIEDIAKGKFTSKNRQGMLVTPPGSGILTQIEETLKVDFTKMKLDETCTVLPTIILQDLNLAKDMTVELNGDKVHLKMFDSLYKNLYSARNHLDSVSLLGCPIASVVACALAKTSGRNVTIQKYQVSPDGFAIEVWYAIVQG